ncbi:MAG: hypothetical protein ACI3Z9_05515 [Candidatus Onthomorpha sp.]
MRKYLLSLVVVLLFASCGGGTTETAIETCAESYSEETSQLNKKYEKTYFDDVFELVSETDRGYLFLSKDMTWYNLYGGSMLFASYGTYTIKNGIVTLTEEYSDSPYEGNNVYKYNIKYKGSDIFLSDTDKEYKICNVENKEKIFGDVIELRRNNKGTQQENTNDYSWMHGKWHMSHTYENGRWYTTLFVDLHIDYNRGTIKVYLAENDNSINTIVNGIQYQLMYSGNFDIDPYSNSIICGRFSFKLDTNKRRIYQNIEGSKTYFSKGSGMNKNYGDSWF